MATPLNTILNWFKTGLKPTQAQFWASWQSFRHLDDKVPQADIDGLQDSFDEKVDVEALPFVVLDGYQVQKQDKTDLTIWELNDKFEGWNGTRKVAGIVIGLPFDVADNTKVKLAQNNLAV